MKQMRLQGSLDRQALKKQVAKIKNEEDMITRRVVHNSCLRRIGSDQEITRTSFKLGTAGEAALIRGKQLLKKQKIKSGKTTDQYIDKLRTSKTPFNEADISEWKATRGQLGGVRKDIIKTREELAKHSELKQTQSKLRQDLATARKERGSGGGFFTIKKSPGYQAADQKVQELKLQKKEIKRQIQQGIGLENRLQKGLQKESILKQQKADYKKKILEPNWQ